MRGGGVEEECKGREGGEKLRDVQNEIIKTRGEEEERGNVEKSKGEARRHQGGRKEKIRRVARGTTAVNSCLV